MANRFSITSVGSSTLSLSVLSGQRLETAPRYEVRTAGTESNVMAAAALNRRGTLSVSAVPVFKQLGPTLRCSEYWEEFECALKNTITSP